MLEVRKKEDGVVTVSLGLEEGLILKTLPDRLRKLLKDPDFSDRVIQRLFPIAYSDKLKEKEYRRLLGDDLVQRKLESVDLFDRSLAGAKVCEEGVDVDISPEEFEYWLGFVNDVRLMLGIELDIRDDNWGVRFDPEHPRVDDLILLHFLSWLEEELLRASDFEMPEIDPEDIPRG